MRPAFLASAFRSLGAAAVQCITEILTLLRGELTLSDNVRFVTKSVTFGGVADVEVTIDITALQLKATPKWIITLDSSNGGVAYQSQTNLWTKTSIRAKCTRASTVALIGVI